jgi:hypothetical protein
MCRKPPSHISRRASIAVLFGDIVIGLEVMTSVSFVWFPSLLVANTRLTASRPVKISMRLLSIGADTMFAYEPAFFRYARRRAQR